MVRLTHLANFVCMVREKEKFEEKMLQILSGLVVRIVHFSMTQDVKNPSLESISI